MPITKKVKKPHYVNNKQFLEAFIKFRSDIDDCKAKGLPEPRTPDYIGECILFIAQRLAQKSNFSKYPYKDEMVSDGIENVLMYIHNFDPNVTNNPFAYFTQIIKFAFIRRIQKEKKQMYIRHKITEQQLYSNIRVDLPSEMIVDNDFVENYEEMLKEKRRKAKDRQNRIDEYDED